MLFLKKASEEGNVFHDIIGTTVTFKCDVVSFGGHLLHFKDEKVVITDVDYIEGHWSRACPDIYVPAHISTFKIENSGGCYTPNSFIEYKDYK